ncbi:hypothetical protein [Paracoccus sp. PAMC 22219]|uniref:hypothetical protein n=1 Tax=Paracoccus sp. PAMC 22219 TaxID=1569209 RepID=UPI0018CF4CA4|nr:hypothetical protein [Paracoccus sp. PAMC 22219]
MFGKSSSRPSVGTAAKDFTTTTPGHRLQFLKGSDTLIVSFDNAARAKNTPFQGRTIWGEKFYREEGHSLLGVIAATNDWFRCRHLITALEDLSGSGFFRQFENVVFAGSSMGAFGAAAFAPLAPGCTVLSLSLRQRWTALAFRGNADSPKVWIRIGLCPTGMRPQGSGRRRTPMSSMIR